MTDRRRRPRARRGRRAARTLVALLVLVGVLAGAVALVVTALERLEPEVPVVARCTATLDGTAWSLSADQAQHAALFAAVAQRRGLPARAVTIAIATALQESRLENIDYGDRDSIGLFQQRPSQGWGTVEQIMDPVYSVGKFYDGLVKVPGYEDMEVTDAAQAVQRSAFPKAYAQHEVRARAWASGLTGHSPATIACTLPAGDGGDPDAVLTRVRRDLGDVPARAFGGGDEPAGVVVDARGLGDDAARSAWAVAAWAVATADELGTRRVDVADRSWTREGGTWTANDRGARAAGTVRIDS
ncbi:hypothetical protein [Cellulomonas uda]|uniref:Cobalt transporter n=1 Tax=Cellulomonas uda TaxID=1714 RepID=A0A4Y3K7A6_CELUD|nr:hypothetical protein [Cellulomonas uda]NII67387.1 hypothetical protein [Cellulomonas uda]GEA79893.1 hypothetical protein CUD01_03370 [Cellulomonas uda]